MALLLIFMSGVISSYWYLTDPQRIKSMSQAYLSELIGGPVEIGSASLTLFEGLKLSHVVVKVDDKTGPDNVLLVTDAIEIQYNPSSLLRGKLQATRIIATSARVKLIEDVETGRWNYQRLKPGKNHPAVTRPSDNAGLPPLPEVRLRDAKVEYGELRNGESNPRGAMAIEGRAFPSKDGERFLFEVQSRGVIEGIGPVATGQILLKNGEVSATLSRFKFGRDIEAMLPREVREFWLAHKLEGGLDIPDFDYTPGTRGRHATFRLRTQLRHVKMIVRAGELETPDLDLKPADEGLLARAAAIGAQLCTRLRQWRVLPEQPPMLVDDVSGDFLFDESGIQFDRVFGSVGKMTVEINGAIGGYSSEAPVKLRIESPRGGVIRLPPNPDFLASLPPAARKAYFMLRPQGTGTLWIEVARDQPGTPPRVNGELNILEGGLNCVFFPYPARASSGQVTFGPDKDRPFERIELRNIHAHGVVGGPNEHSDILLNGWVADDADAGCHLHFSSDSVSSEPELFIALPPPVRKVMKIFHGPGTEKNLQGRGAFVCDVLVPAGKGKVHPIVTVDLNLVDGAGSLAVFPYPLEKLHGIVNIGDGSVAVHDLKLTHGKSTVTVSGRVTWPADAPDDVTVIATPDIQLAARDVPIDDELLKVLPADASRWIRSAGLQGVIDVDGPIVLQPTPADPGAIGFDLGISLRDAKAKPGNGDFAISDLTGKLVVHSDKVDVTELHGRRDSADLKGSGVVNWSTGRPQITMNAAATNLPLDAPLQKLMSAPGRHALAAIDPTGTIDAELFFAGLVRPGSQTSAAPTVEPGDFKLTVHPRVLSLKAKAMPYQLDRCTGSVSIDPSHITINDFSGHHGKATVVISGRGLTAQPGDWDFVMKLRDARTDADLRKALPPALRKMMSDLKFDGEVDLDLQSLKYRGDRRKDAEPDVDLNGVVHARGATLDAGMTLTNLSGDLGFNAAVRRGKTAAFHGDIALDSVAFADRPVTGFKAVLDLPAGSDTLDVGKIQGQIAGGDVAGDVKVRLPDQGASSYSMDFVIKNADVREIAKQVAPNGQEIRGQVSASLALQGEWSDPATRRGRGDVLVSGKEMYQIPLMLGLMEVTNLSLPTTSPFNEGTARYLVEGQRVTFEQVQMRSSRLVMSGNGYLDFDTKKVRMNFTTENPRLPNLPIIHDLLAGAKQELLQIQVRGTVQHPTVSAASLHTFTTTVDEVLSGDQRQ